MAMSINIMFDCISKLYGYKKISEFTKEECNAIVKFIDIDNMLTNEYWEDEDIVLGAIDMYASDKDSQTIVINNFVEKYKFDYLYTLGQVSHLMTSSINSKFDVHAYIKLLNFKLFGNNNSHPEKFTLTSDTLLSDFMTKIYNESVTSKLYCGV